MSRRINVEGSIVKRKDGRWIRDSLAEQDKGTYCPDIKLKDYMEQWLEDSVRDSVRERTYERYEQVYRNHIVPVLGDTSLPSLTEMDIQSLYRKKLDSGRSPRTVQYIHITLHKALKQAVGWRLVPTDVSEGATPPEVHKKEITVLSPDQVKVGDKRPQAGSHVHPGHHRRVEAGRVTGAPVGGYRHCGSVFYVVRTLSKTNRGVVFSPPKTTNGRRAVGLTQVAIEALEIHRANQKK